MKALGRFMKYLLLGGTLFLVACTPPNPTMTREEAEVACRAEIAKPVKTNTSIGVGINSSGKVRPRASISVGVDVSAASNPQKAYENCVRRNSGENPVEPF